MLPLFRAVVKLRKPMTINVPDHFAATEQLAIFRRDFNIAG